MRRWGKAWEYHMAANEQQQSGVRQWLGRRREPMSRVDNAWLRMESPTNLMMITSVLMFDEPIDFDRLIDLLESRFLRFRRFRQRPVEIGGLAFWEDDPDFDIRAHVLLTGLPGSGGRDELADRVSALASTALDPSRPMWQFQVVEGYGRGSALISRIHHCYADGMALVQVMMSLTDKERNPEALANPKAARLKRFEGGVIQRLLKPARAGMHTAFEVGGKVREEAMRSIGSPAHLATRAKQAGQIANELMSALTLDDDPETVLRGRLGVRKRVAWCEPLDLDEVKSIAKAMDCKVNDLLVAAVTGALRGYMIERGEACDGLTIRATIPVNLRPLEHAHQLGNHFGLVFLPLPIGVANPLARLQAVQSAMNELKQSQQAVVSFGLLSALGVGPQALQRPTLDMMSRKASAVLTNVPGPQQDLYVAGTRIDQQMFWVPQNGSIGMGISILSYRGMVQFGLMTDRRLVPDPDAIIARFPGEFEKLLLATVMLPADLLKDPCAAESILTDALNAD